MKLLNCRWYNNMKLDNIFSFAQTMSSKPVAQPQRPSRQRADNSSAVSWRTQSGRKLLAPCAGQNQNDASGPAGAVRSAGRGGEWRWAPGGCPWGRTPPGPRPSASGGGRRNRRSARREAVGMGSEAGGNGSARSGVEAGRGRGLGLPAVGFVFDRFEPPQVLRWILTFRVDGGWCGSGGFDPPPGGCSVFVTCMAH